MNQSLQVTTKINDHELGKWNMNLQLQCIFQITGTFGHMNPTDRSYNMPTLKIRLKIRPPEFVMLIDEK